MNKYELAIILNGKLEDEARTETMDTIKGYIERFGGTVSNVEEWGKKRLAYEINKMKDGFYYFITFESEGSTPIEIEKRVRIMEPVIRFLNIRLDN